MTSRILILLLVVGCLLAQESVWEGVYTDQQATRGEASYGEMCASCHGDKLAGRGPTPPLAGDDFLTNWNGMSVGDLFEKTQTSMPADRPGQLSKDQTAAIIAYILKFNKFPAGSKELAANADALKTIRIEAVRKNKD